METITMPYKLQVFLPDELRSALKVMAHQQGTSLQKLVVSILAASLHTPAAESREPTTCETIISADVLMQG